jgi:putative FmdB family regulatory protein
MPIYEYRCAACGRSFERLVHGQQMVACPACDSPNVTRLLSLFGFKSGQGFVASSSGAGVGAAAAGAGAAATEA